MKRRRLPYFAKVWIKISHGNELRIAVMNIVWTELSFLISLCHIRQQNSQDQISSVNKMTHMRNWKLLQRILNLFLAFSTFMAKFSVSSSIVCLILVYNLTGTCIQHCLQHCKWNLCSCKWPICSCIHNNWWWRKSRGLGNQVRWLNYRIYRCITFPE